MTKERAYEIAKTHATYGIGDVSFFPLQNGRNLHIQTLHEPSFYDDADCVTYIDIEDDNGDCIETHTTEPNDIDDIAFWIHELCYDTEEK